ncbi:hypothetical protein BJ322DRAFT_243150 [Thelephora terrestris]|uniref:F-box domain-containing protein n=1 Tax=Thelephora terrestris TaxID=56493 RepID=A0A9P6L443_9AGAM|nr:hypothetical protein BJ322DRAFT_243150 [Thelephora terrestris]
MYLVSRRLHEPNILSPEALALQIGFLTRFCIAGVSSSSNGQQTLCVIRILQILRNCSNAQLCILKLVGVLGRSARSVITKVRGREMSADAMMRKKMDVEVVEELADLNLLSAGIYRGCMGLPQELIDDIINVLFDDPRALRACSLTCRAMFASTRRLIHQTLHLTRRNHKPALVSLRMEGDERYMSYMADRDLLRYTRQLHIHDSCIFSPGTLGPHLYRFRQSLNRVHTLIIEGYDAIRWANLHKPCFIHLYSTLTSLTLIRPFGHCQLILQFALQFPNLENLCLERPYNRRFGPYEDP